MNRTNYQTDQRISYYASEGRIMELPIAASIRAPRRRSETMDLNAKVTDNETLIWALEADPSAQSGQ